MHREARLNMEERQALIHWVRTSLAAMRTPNQDARPLWALRPIFCTGFTNQLSSDAVQTSLLAWLLAFRQVLNSARVKPVANRHMFDAADEIGMHPLYGSG